MKHRYYLLATIFLALGCNKEKFFDGPDHYEDGFENYIDKSELISDDEIHWTNSQLTMSENYFALDTNIVHSGNKSLKFFAKASNSTVSKCSIAKQNMAFWEGETVRVSVWYYIVGTSPSPWIFLMDVEEQVAIGAGPGIRLAMDDSGNEIVVEHKFSNPNIYQTNPIVFPRNQWVNLVMEIKLSQRKKGSVKIYQDGTLIVDQNKWKTLPKDFLYAQQGTKGIYSSIEVGITANTKAGDVTLYMDDVKIEKI